MKNLQIDDKTAREVYPSAADSLKKILEKTFGKDFFYQSLIDRIKTWDDVCAETGKDPIKSLPFPEATDEDQEAANAHWRITQTIKLFKSGKKCSYKPNNNQNKYFVWMEYGKIPSGLGFSFTGTYCDFTNAAVGPRLSSLSDADAKHIATVVCKNDYETYFNE